MVSDQWNTVFLLRTFFTYPFGRTIFLFYWNIFPLILSVKRIFAIVEIRIKCSTNNVKYSNSGRKCSEQGVIFFRLRKIPASEESCYAIISSCIYELLVINAGGGGYRHGKRVGISIKLAWWDKKWTNQRKTARSTSLCCRRLSSSDSPMGSPKRLSVKRTMCCVASKLYASSFHQQMTSNARFLCVCSLHGYGKKPSYFYQFAARPSLPAWVSFLPLSNVNISTWSKVQKKASDELALELLLT